MLTLYILLLPLIASLITLAAKGQAARVVALFFTMLELTFTIYVYGIFKTAGPERFNLLTDWIEQPKINFHIGMDGVSMLMVLLTNLLLPLIVLSGFNRTTKRPHIFYALMQFMQFALLGVFVSFDGLLYYIFWELALIPIYFIAFSWGGENRGPVTIKFFIYTLAGSLLMLFGFMFLYVTNGSQALDWRILSAHHTCSCNQTWLFWLLFSAFAIKIPIIPFHTWQPDTYKTAPTQGTMLLAGIMLKMGTYSLVRWLLPIVPNGVAEWRPLVMGLCVAGIVYTSVIAIMQRDLKKLFAYSSIAHVGLISAGIFSLTLQGLQGSMVQMLAHGVNVVGLFLCADIVMNRTQKMTVDGLGGIRLVAPQFATWFMVVILASVALPLTNAFIGEFLLLFGVYQYNAWMGGIAGLTIILGAVYMLRMYQRVVLGESVHGAGSVNDPVKGFTDLMWNEKAVLLIVAGLIFLFGVYPQPILDLTEPVLKNLVK
jgi:NADH-quinone oxidoreductase subunit M